MVQFKTVQFPNTAAGQAAKIRTLEKGAAQGWRVISETIVSGKFKGGKACCLFTILPPCAFFAGHKNDIITVTLQKDLSDVPAGYVSESDAQVRCPDCREWVRHDAKVCKHCKRKLEPQIPATSAPTLPTQASPSGNRVKKVALPYKLTRTHKLIGIVVLSIFAIGYSMSWYKSYKIENQFNDISHAIDTGANSIAVGKLELIDNSIKARDPRFNELLQKAKLAITKKDCIENSIKIFETMSVANDDNSISALGSRCARFVPGLARRLKEREANAQQAKTEAKRKFIALMLQPGELLTAAEFEQIAENQLPGTMKVSDMEYWIPMGSEYFRLVLGFRKPGPRNASEIVSLLKYSQLPDGIAKQGKLIGVAKPGASPSSQTKGSETVFALEAAPCYNGPSKGSGRFFFVATASQAMTLTKNDKYEILLTRNGWSKVRLYPPSISEKTAWVESRFLDRTRAPNVERQIAEEGLDAFDSIVRAGNWHPVYAGVKQAGKKLTFVVSDRWNGLSRDVRGACVRDLYVLFFQIGVPRNITEKAEEFHIEVRHEASGRVVATWEGLSGLRLKE